jgi:hypothetical protein
MALWAADRAAGAPVEKAALVAGSAILQWATSPRPVIKADVVTLTLSLTGTLSPTATLTTGTVTTEAEAEEQM